MVTKTVSQPSSTRKASQSAPQNGSKSVSGVRAMRHLVNSDGTKGGDVILDGHNFGPTTDSLRNLVEIHRVACRRKEAAYASDDDDLTPDQETERELANQASMMAALNIMSRDSTRPKADNVAVMLYVEEAGGDIQILQGLSYSDLRVFRDAYSAHVLKPTKPPALNVFSTIQAHRAAIKNLLAAGEAIDLPRGQEATTEDMHAYYTACSAEIAAALEVVALVNAAGNTDWALPEERAAIITYGGEQSSGQDPLGTDSVKLFGEVPYECIDVLRKWYQGELVEADKSAPNDGTSSKLAELIDRHRVARQAVSDFDVHTTPEPEQERIMAVESDAFEAVLLFRCNTIGEIQQKADYLVNGLDNGNRLFEGELDSPITFISQFMRSMLPESEKKAVATPARAKELPWSPASELIANHRAAFERLERAIESDPGPNAPHNGAENLEIAVAMREEFIAAVAVCEPNHSHTWSSNDKDILAEYVNSTDGKGLSNALDIFFDNYTADALTVLRKWYAGLLIEVVASPESLDDLVAKHKTTAAYFLEMCKATDEVVIKRKATSDETAECTRAEIADSRAADDIIAYVPRSKAELVEKIRYIHQAEIHCSRFPNLNEKAFSALLKSWDIFARPFPSSVDEAISNHKTARDMLSATDYLPDESPLYADEYIALDRLIDLRPQDLSEAQRKVAYLLSIDKGARIGLNGADTLLSGLLQSLMPADA